MSIFNNKQFFTYFLYDRNSILVCKTLITNNYDAFIIKLQYLKINRGSNDRKPKPFHAIPPLPVINNSALAP